MKKAIIAIAGAGLLASACASDPYGGTNETVRQGAIGAGIGAVAGAIIGNNVGDGNAGTGAAIGAPGGARMASDLRLRLAPCGGPLAVSWHTPARTAVQVECPGPTSWRIFVAIAPSTGNAAAGKPAPAVKRGDAITVMVRGRGFSVQQTGEAMEAGAVGDWIEVRTSRKGEPLRARIERPGLAVIPAA